MGGLTPFEYQLYSRSFCSYHTNVILSLEQPLGYVKCPYYKWHYWNLETLSHVQKITRPVSCCQVEKTQCLLDSADWSTRTEGLACCTVPYFNIHALMLVPGIAGYLVSCAPGEHIHHSCFSLSIATWEATGWLWPTEPRFFVLCSLHLTYILGEGRRRDETLWIAVISMFSLYLLFYWNHNCLWSSSFISHSFTNLLIYMLIYLLCDYSSNNKNNRFIRAFYVPGFPLNGLQVWTHLVFMTDLWCTLLKRKKKIPQQQEVKWLAKDYMTSNWQKWEERKKQKILFYHLSR